jgi:hypothetical protein
MSSYENNKSTIMFGKNRYIVTTTINTLTFKVLDYNNSDDINFVTGNQAKTKYPYKIVDQYNIYLPTTEDTQELKRLLTNAYESRVFTFKDVIFDFSHLYERKCIDSIID